MWLLCTHRSASCEAAARTEALFRSMSWNLNASATAATNKSKYEEKCGGYITNLSMRRFRRRKKKNNGSRHSRNHRNMKRNLNRKAFGEQPRSRRAVRQSNQKSAKEKK